MTVEASARVTRGAQAAGRRRTNSPCRSNHPFDGSSECLVFRLLAPRDQIAVMQMIEFLERRFEECSRRGAVADTCVGARLDLFNELHDDGDRWLKVVGLDRCAHVADPPGRPSGGGRFGKQPKRLLFAQVPCILDPLPGGAHGSGMEALDVSEGLRDPRFLKPPAVFANGPAGCHDGRQHL